MTDKEKIDYHFKLRREDKNKSIENFGCSFILAFILFVVLLAIIHSIN